MSIVDQVDGLKKTIQVNGTEGEVFNGYQAAINDFNKLIDAGVIEKRGYTLRTMDEGHLYNSSL